MLALPHEPLVADMHVVAVDLAFDAQTDVVVDLVAGRQIDAELARLAAQGLGDGMLQTGFGRRGKAEQVSWELCSCCRR